jgi:hypothetical protein
MMATVVGAMLDLFADRGNEFGDVSQYIFGPSAVSGGSVGAVVMRTTLPHWPMLSIERSCDEQRRY